MGRQLRYRPHLYCFVSNTASCYRTAMEHKGTLAIVATPIGNLEDMSYRAVRTLSQADYILCEDTRVTGRLKERYNIKTPLKRYDAHVSDLVHERIISDLKDGKQIALVSDAGTPGVSDPGTLLVKLVREADAAHIVAIPGPSAVVTAFSLTGITGNQFSFLGFVPQKKGRETFFKSLATRLEPVIFFESTHRIMKALQSLQNELPHAQVYLGRELTKLHEEMLIGTPEELIYTLTTEPVRQKGEFVVIIEL